MFGSADAEFVWKMAVNTSKGLQYDAACNFAEKMVELSGGRVAVERRFHTERFPVA